MGIELINLSMKIGETVILNNINERINSGECYCLLGTSGSGKSSLLKAINGLAPYVQGEVVVDGENIYAYSQVEMLNYHRRCGFVFQNAALLSNMSVMENLVLGFRYHSELSESQITQRVLPELEYYDMNTNLLNQQPSFLSAGEKMISCIIRAHLKQPSYFFWDEPLSSLDHIYQSKVKQRMIEMKQKGITMILVTNRAGLAFELADRIGILDKGQLIASATPEEIQKETHETVQILLERN